MNKHQIYKESNSYRNFDRIAKLSYKQLNENKDTIFYNSNRPIVINESYKQFKDSVAFDEYLTATPSQKNIIIEKFIYENIYRPIYNSLNKKIHLVEENIKLDIIYENTGDIIYSKILGESTYNTIKDMVEKKFDELYEHNNGYNIEYTDMVEEASSLKQGYFNFRSGVKLAVDSLIDATRILQILIEIIFSGVYMAYNSIPMFIKTILDQITNFFLNFFPNYKIQLKFIEKQIEILNLDNNRQIKDYLKDYSNVDLAEILRTCWNENKLSNEYSYSNAYGIKNIFEILSKALNFMHSTAVSSENFKDFISMIKSVFTRDPKKLSTFRMCSFTKTIDILKESVKVSIEMSNISKELFKPLNNIDKINKNNINNLMSNLYNKEPANEAESFYIRSISFLINIKFALEDLENFERTHKQNLNIDPYYFDDMKKMKNLVNQAFKEINDYYSTKNNTFKKYEENYKQNNQKNLIGNEPTKPKKINIFDV